MLFAFLQDAAGQAADTAATTPTPTPTKPAVPAIDVAKAANDLVHDPASTVSKWIELGWKMLQEHGPGVLGAMILLFVSYVFAKWSRRVVIKALQRAHVDITLAKFFGNLAKWTIIIFAFISAAGTIGISTTGFAALIGAAGLAVGLSLQGNLGNLAAGVLLLVFRPFKIGDAVVVAGQAGVIDGIDLFTTNIDTGDNRRVIIPNGAIFGGVIENQSHHPRRRVDYSITLAGGTDIDRNRKILLGILKHLAESGIGAIDDPANAATLTEINPNQVWMLNLWARTPSAGAVEERLLIELRRTIDKEQIGVQAPVQLVRQVS